ncbi:SsgA family sporulation/cell division regulator [Streptomyces sp. TLI_171]|uniref:SsgA family sporulation/cell division regulator n=1 Tax=Streptomyces sp. TLI_171 TaxID=1938859 RepID=UPI000C5E92CA|nr:SsgA family sporulation/cell division regulator [Streptomyces sp. TLI_171]RKE17372.1 sporulation and cell division protein SsgA [Streptomyces sp. TLI_171]
MPDAVRRSVSVTLPGSALPHLAMAAQLRFDPALPYAVRLAFLPGLPDGEEVEWCFGRDLLAEGCRAPSGEGDVRVSPGRGDRVLVTLSNGLDRAVIGVPAGPVAEFLADAFAAVPAGAESEYLELDPGLARLLA